MADGVSLIGHKSALAGPLRKNGAPVAGQYARANGSSGFLIITVRVICRVPGAAYESLLTGRLEWPVQRRQSTGLDLRKESRATL